MTRKTTILQRKTLERITQHLIIYSMALDNISLMNGKMGIALFFYHLHKITKKNNHLAFANELIRIIISKLDYKTTVHLLFKLQQI